MAMEASPFSKRFRVSRETFIRSQNSTVEMSRRRRASRRRSPKALSCRSTEGKGRGVLVFMYDNLDKMKQFVNLIGHSMKYNQQNGPIKLTKKRACTFNWTILVNASSLI